MSNTSHTISILSVNVGRSSAAQQIALRTAHTPRTDFLLIQEPYICKNTERKITCRHPYYECYAPVDDWSTRPRVLSYSRKNNNPTHYQECSDIAIEQGLSDILFLSVRAPNNPRLLIFNVNKPPSGAINSGSGVSYLLFSPKIHLSPNTILAGDFNLHHPTWHPSYHGSPSPQSEAFNHWLECRDLSLISEIDVPTHNCGNVLDLVFGSSQLEARGTLASVRQDLDVTSDHLPLLVTAHCGTYGSMPKTSIRFATIDEENFQISLLAQLADISRLSDKSCASLDQRAQRII
ncbi:hypothetical protein K3495_g3164 [Podosphaera aphanis]|nr:hypothetical protein K3495_g3164 [Podosphaera aphanis]